MVQARPTGSAPSPAAGGRTRGRRRPVQRRGRAFRSPTCSAPGAYYLALGYENPYRWAHYRDVPFTPLRKPLDESTVALVTTAAPCRPELGDQGPGAPYNGAAKFFEVYSAPAGPEEAPDVRISHVSYDRIHTTAKDPRTWFPPRPPARGGGGRPYRPVRAPASTAFRRTAAGGPPSTRTARPCSGACTRTRRTRPSWSPTDRCATSP